MFVQNRGQCRSGYGGAVSFADLDRRLAVGFTKNLFNKANARARILELLRGI